MEDSTQKCAFVLEEPLRWEVEVSALLLASDAAAALAKSSSGRGSGPPAFDRPAKKCFKERFQKRSKNDPPVEREWEQQALLRALPELLLVRLPAALLA